jgi:riboflavin synthase
MFTGLVEELGELVAVTAAGDGAIVRVRAARIVEGAAPGDSVAVDGCCLTIEALAPDGFTARAVPETLRRTTLGRRAPGDAVDLERPVRPLDRLGGHIVQGHVDGIAQLRRADDLADGSRWLEVALPDGLDRYVVVKGSIALDGVSLTVAAAGAGWCAVAIVPHTAGATVLGRRGVGDVCNVEVDCLAKHVERLLAASGSVAPDPARARERTAVPR